MVKEKIIQALFNAQNDLTNEDIQWAIQNIPNEGTEPMVFNHDESSLFAACGMDVETVAKSHAEYLRIRESTEENKKSYIIEEMLKRASPQLMRSLLICGVVEYESRFKMKDEVFNQLKKFFDDM